MQSPNGNGIRIPALAGSFRMGSFNQALIRAAREPAPDHVRIVDFDLRTAPFYEGDLGAAGYPAEVTAPTGAIAWPAAPSLEGLRSGPGSFRHRRLAHTTLPHRRGFYYYSPECEEG